MIAESDYTDIVERTSFDDESARIYFMDESFLEVWLGNNEDLMRRYAFHWERRHLDGTLFRHDRAPHARWQCSQTFPKHFHNGSESKVVESTITDDPVAAAKYFLDFVRSKSIAKKR